MTLKHRFTATQPDNTTAHIKNSYWNEDHRTDAGDTQVFFACTTYIATSANLTFDATQAQFVVGPGPYADGAIIVSQGGTPCTMYIETDASQNFGFTQNTATPGTLVLAMYTSRGLYSAPNATVSGDDIGGIEVFGHAGSGFGRAASLHGLVDATPSGGVTRGRWVFRTTTAAGTEPEVLRLDSVGRVIAGSTGAYGEGTLTLDPLGTTCAYLMESTATTNSGLTLVNATPGSLNLSMVTTRGTTTSPNAVLSGDVLGNLIHLGYDGTNYKNSVIVRGTADANGAGGAAPGRLDILTQDSTGTTQQALAIDSHQCATFSAPVTVNQGTATAGQPALTLTSTWNTAGASFCAFMVNVTCTTAANLSSLMDLKVNNCSLLTYFTRGYITADPPARVLLLGRNDPYVHYYIKAADSSVIGTQLNIVAGDVTPRTHAVTGANLNLTAGQSGTEANGGCAVLMGGLGDGPANIGGPVILQGGGNNDAGGDAGNVYILGGTKALAAAGKSGSVIMSTGQVLVSGSHGDLRFQTNLTDKWKIVGKEVSSGNVGDLLANTDGQVNIGASGANRPLNVYVSGCCTIGNCGTFGTVRITSIPTTSVGLSTGQIWSCNGYLRIA